MPPGVPVPESVPPLITSPFPIPEIVEFAAIPTGFRLAIQQPLPCDATCGGGVEVAAVICLGRANLPLPIETCRQTFDTIELDCATDPCGDVYYTFEEWGECEIPDNGDSCGEGTRSRDFSCVSGDVPDMQCEAAGVEAPAEDELVYACEAQGCAVAVYKVGVWEDQCRRRCLRSRSVLCELDGNAVEDELCQAARPNEAVGCAEGECVVDEGALGGGRKLKQAEVPSINDCESGIRAV